MRPLNSMLPIFMKRPLIAQYAGQTCGLANLRDLQPRYACLDRPQRNVLSLMSALRVISGTAIASGEEVRAA